jgi:hypothetical protein
MRRFKVTSFPVKIGKFLVIQMTDDAAEQFKTALEDGDMFDFSQVGDDDVNIVAEFEGVGQGEVV